MIACWQWAFVLGEAPWAPITVRFMRSSTRSTPRLAAHADLTANVDFVYLVEALAGFGAICSSLQFNLRSTWWNKKATTKGQLSQRCPLTYGHQPRASLRERQHSQSVGFHSIGFT